MKWNILLGTMVLGLGLCTQSFGFELLDRMLGAGQGAPSCCDTAPSCGCDHVGGHGHGRSCCDPAPTCGCETACAPSCCDSAPACGCETACDSGCAPKCGKRVGLLDHLFASRKCCAPACDTAPTCGCDKGCPPVCGCDKGCPPKCGCDKGCPPVCGCEPVCKPACDTACAPKCGKRRGLLDRIFSCSKPVRRCNSCCDAAPACGCEPSCGAVAPMAPAEVDAEDAVPVPPAPMADPSAYVPTQRRVVQASVNIVR